MNKRVATYVKSACSDWKYLSTNPHPWPSKYSPGQFRLEKSTNICFAIMARFGRVFPKSSGPFKYLMAVAWHSFIFEANVIFRSSHIWVELQIYRFICRIIPRFFLVAATLRWDAIDNYILKFLTCPCKKQCTIL